MLYSSSDLIYYETRIGKYVEENSLSVF